jgi:hypothetical protein
MCTHWGWDQKIKQGFEVSFYEAMDQGQRVRLATMPRLQQGHIKLLTNPLRDGPPAEQPS